MASRNQLLGSGILYQEPIVNHIEPTFLRVPSWRYHKDCPQGRIFKTDEELDKADATGWMDHPGKVTKLPAFEHLFEGEEEEAELLEDQIEIDEYEVVKNPQSGERTCLLCGQDFENIAALNLHGTLEHLSEEEKVDWSAFVSVKESKSGVSVKKKKGK